MDLMKLRPIIDVLAFIGNYALQLFYLLNTVFLKIFGVPLQPVGGLTASNEDEVDDKASITEGTTPNSSRKLKRLQDIPGPRVLPFFGTLLTSSALTSSDLKKANEDQFKKYGPLVKEEHFWNVPIIMVSEADDVDLVVKNAQSLRPPMEILAKYREMRPDRYSSVGLVCANGEGWLTLRKAFTPRITSPKFVQTLIPEANNMAADLVKNISKLGPVIQNFDSIINSYVAENSFYLMMGTRVGFMNTEVETPENLKIFFDVHKQYWLAFHESLYGYPWWKYFPTKVWREFTLAEDAMYAIVDDISKAAMEKGTSTGLMHEFLKEEGVSMLDRKTAILEFILGATEPVLYTNLLLLYWISKYDRVLDKVVEELRSVFPTKDNMQIDFDTLNNLPYLKACMMETFRICPTSPNLARILEHDLELQGYLIPAYSVIICQTWYSYLQKKNFCKPDEFWPERWLDEPEYKDKFTPHRGAIVRIFGFGKRMCPGRRVALQSHQIMLAQVLRNFRLTFSGDFDIKYEFLLTPTPPVHVNVEEYAD